MTLLELNINLDRVADALERIAGVLERALPEDPIPEVGMSKLHQVRRPTTSADEEWRAYAPPVRKGYTDDE